MRHIESQLQQNMIWWFRYAYPKHTLYAIPNGGARSKTEGAIMKGEGVLSGVADMFLMHAAQGYHGLYIEVKTPKGRQTDSQKAFEKEAFSAGYKYVIVRSVEEFMKIANEYLK